MPKNICRVDKETFKRILLAVAGLVVFFALMDVLGYHLWHSIGGWEGEAYQTAKPWYLMQFWSFAFVMVLVAGLIYYLLRKDLSESLAVIIAGCFAMFSGLEDLLFYIFLKLPLDASMPWLMVTPVSTATRILGYETVTPTTLILNIILFGFIGFYLINWLYKRRW